MELPDLDWSGGFQHLMFLRRNMKAAFPIFPWQTSIPTTSSLLAHSENMDVSEIWGYSDLSPVWFGYWWLSSGLCGCPITVGYQAPERCVLDGYPGHLTQIRDPGFPHGNRIFFWQTITFDTHRTHINRTYIYIYIYIFIYLFIFIFTYIQYCVYIYCEICMILE